ncbi:MAG: hypothetical protein ACI8W3_003835 [Myxococcota bacterium]|jgi:hypothetical protein
MSEEWIFYPCQMDEHKAFISYDHGIRETIGSLPQRLVKYRIELNQPNPDGLAAEAEFSVLAALEAELRARLEGVGGLLVGRITVDGARYYHAYADVEDDIFAALASQAAAGSDYNIDYACLDDPEREGYWKELFPTDRDWQVIQDLKAISTLREHGDLLERPRRIDHWAYFPSLAARAGFEQWALAHEFVCETCVAENDLDFPHGLQVHHDATPEFDEITAHSIALMEACQSEGGRYDGWETEVVPPNATA